MTLYPPLGKYSATSSASLAAMRSRLVVCRFCPGFIGTRFASLFSKPLSNIFDPESMGMVTRHSKSIINWNFHRQTKNQRHGTRRYRGRKTAKETSHRVGGLLAWSVITPNERERGERCSYCSRRSLGTNARTNEHPPKGVFAFVRSFVRSVRRVRVRPPF